MHTMKGERRIYVAASCVVMAGVLSLMYGAVSPNNALMPFESIAVTNKIQSSLITNNRSTSHDNVLKQQHAQYDRTPTISHSQTSWVIKDNSTPQNNVLKGQYVQHERIRTINHTLPSYNSSVITKSRLLVVSIFPHLLDASYNTTSYGNISEAKLEQRMLDYLESLQYTLTHPLVSEVHVLYDQDAMPDYVSNRVETHSKLEFDKLEDAYKARYVLKFVHEKFQDKLIMITNGDIYPGEGLEYLSYDLMKSKRLFYTPSRHGRRETRCTMPPDVCDDGGRYLGAHDAYIFVPMDSLPTNASLLLSHNKWDSYGTENVMLYMYRHYLNYNILNPCKVIFLYHNHCSALRHIDRQRIQPRSLVAAPTDRLQ